MIIKLVSLQLQKLSYIHFCKLHILYILEIQNDHAINFLQIMSLTNSLSFKIILKYKIEIHFESKKKLPSFKSRYLSQRIQLLNNKEHEIINLNSLIKISHLLIFDKILN